jgi:hypothetical protein
VRLEIDVLGADHCPCDVSCRGTPGEGRGSQFQMSLSSHMPIWGSPFICISEVTSGIALGRDDPLLPAVDVVLVVVA